MAVNGKDVIYVDVDDEITTVIDKVANSSDKIVALVLPKRASTFQSVVNMKLLKHRADSAKKHLVLITSETGLLPLAGSAGIHVASTLQSKPEIPVGPLQNIIPEDVDEDEAMSLPNEDFDARKDGTKSVGDLANASGASGIAPTSNQMPEETIELDNSDIASGDPTKPADVAALAAAGGAGKGGKKGKKKDKSLKVPNFEKFRLKFVILALVLIALIVAWILANDILPKAVITIKTNTSSINTNLTPTLNTAATSVNTSTQVVPATVQQLQKNYTQQVSATGQQNNGTKASGTVTMSIPCTDVSGSSPTSIPAGTGISSNNLTFVTDTAVSLTNSSFQGGCTFNGSTSVTAQQGGTQYNVQPTTFSVAGYSDVTATSSDAMSGGTDNIQTVVQQSDIDSATKQLTAQVNKNAIKSQLEQSLQSAGKYPITASFTASTPTPSASTAVGSQASSVTVSETITYTMFGAKKTDLQKLIDANVNQQIDTSKQSIQNDGFGNADITVPNAGSGSTLAISIQTTATVGPQLKLDSLKQQIVGMKSGAVQSLIEGDPGVQNVTVKFSPFWIDAVPKHTNKITFVFEKA
jgi:hypothetical protein